MKDKKNYAKSSQDNILSSFVHFFGRIENSKNCFRGILTFNEKRKKISNKHAPEQVSCEVSPNFEGIYFLASMNACIYFPCLSYIFEVKSSESETYLTFR